MLKITIDTSEQWDETNNLFIAPKSETILLEHSLVSISKWEAKWHKPFLSKDNKTYEETIDYIKCMTLTDTVDSNIYNFISNGIIKKINDYIENPMTATVFYNETNKPNREIITSELIYYWMVSFNIPIECQNWHLNRLLTLIKLCNMKNTPTKKMSRSELIARNRKLNRERLNKFNTRG